MLNIADTRKVRWGNCLLDAGIECPFTIEAMSWRMVFAWARCVCVWYFIHSLAVEVKKPAIFIPQWFPFHIRPLLLVLFSCLFFIFSFICKYLTLPLVMLLINNCCCGWSILACYINCLHSFYKFSWHITRCSKCVAGRITKIKYNQVADQMKHLLQISDWKYIKYIYKYKY